MSLLEDLIPGYANLSDEELSTIIETGRLGNEEVLPKKKPAARKAKNEDKFVEIDEDELI